MKIKTLSFYAIAFCLPVLVVVVLEGILRISNYGEEFPLFIPHDSFANHLQTNPEVVRRFFNDPASAPSVSPDTFIFPASKSANTLRLVTMGGSTMAGYPYGRFGSPAGMLQQRINAQYPDLNVEVISVAMSAINSYALLDFADEVTEISPDAVLVYAGHNEYLGIMGTSSALAGDAGHMSKRLFLALKDYKLYQLIAQIIRSIRSEKGASNTEVHGRTLMAIAAQGQKIPYNSEVYYAGIEQFEVNLQALIDKFKRRNIPVFISTIAANIKDQAPFASITDESIDHVIGRIKQRPERAKHLTDKPIVLQASSMMHANFMFTMGQALINDGRYSQAVEFLVNAQDYDLLRFRAPSQFNRIIQAISDAPNVHLVDAYSLLSSKANIQGIIGNDLMLEHLHPNTFGYFWIAEAFFASLQQTSILPTPKRNISPDIAYAWQPVSPSEILFAEHNIARLTSDYPFTDTPQTVAPIEPSNPIESIAVERINGQPWLANQQALVTELQKLGKPLEAGIVAGNLYNALPQQPQLARIASLLLAEAYAFPLAEYYAREAVEAESKNTNYRLTYAEILYRQGKTEQAIAQIDEVLNIDPTNSKALQIRQQI